MEYSKSVATQVTEAKEEVMTGTYTGDGTANRVLDIGFTPKALWIYPAQPAGVPPPSNLVAQSAAIESGFSSSFWATDAWASNPEYFQGIVPNGFKTGTNAFGDGTNPTGVPFFWIAFE